MYVDGAMEIADHNGSPEEFITLIKKTNKHYTIYSQWITIVKYSKKNVK